MKASTAFAVVVLLFATAVLSQTRTSSATLHSDVKQVAQAVPTGAYLAQNPGPVATATGYAPVTLTLASAPAVGDMLIAFISCGSAVTPATGFVAAQSDDPLKVYYGIVGQNSLTSSTTYTFGSSSAYIGQLVDIAGENTFLAPSFSTDVPQYGGNVSLNETVLAANGLTLSAFGGISTTNTNWLNSSIFSSTLPGAQTQTAYTPTNEGNSSYGLAQALNVITSEAFSATPNPFTVAGSFSVNVEPTPPGYAYYNGVVVTVLPAPSPTPTVILATPPAGKFYISARYNEYPENQSNNAEYDQSQIAAFESTIFPTGSTITRLAVNSHFHEWTDAFPWANSTSNPENDYGTSPTGIPTTMYNAVNTDEEDDAANGRYVLTTWNCGDTNWNVAHGVDDAQIIDKAERFRHFGKRIFVRWFHEMNLSYTSDGHTKCLDGMSGGGTYGTSANLSGDATPNPSAMPPIAGYFNPGEFKAAWIHVHDLVRSIAPNVNFVWVPSGGGMSDAASFAPHLYYPGDQYVEWIAFDDYERRTTGTFNGFTSSGAPLPCAVGGATPGPTYYCPNTIYTEVIKNSPKYTQVPWVTPSPKPLFVTESAAVQTNQSNWMAADAATGRSIVPETIASYFPQISAFSYFDSSGSTTWYLTGSPASPKPAPNGYTQFSLIAKDMNSAAGPSPSPTAAPTAAGFTVNTGALATSTTTTVTVAPSALPAAGNTLIVALVPGNPLPAGSPSLPAGWNVLQAASSGYLETAYCIVGTASGNCPAQTSYTFSTSGGAIAQIVTVTGANATIYPPISALDTPASTAYGVNTITEQVANLVIPRAGGVTLTIWSGYSGSTKLSNPRGVSGTNPGMFQIFPQSQSPQISTLSSQLNYQISMATGFYYDLAMYQMNFESYSSAAPFFTASARYFPISGTGSTVNSDGTIIWLHP